MSDASVEATLDLWSAALRETKTRLRALFAHPSVAASAAAFLDGLLGPERRKTGWISSAGQRLYLWRAVDDEGEVLDVLVQSTQNRPAALRPMRKLFKKQGYAPAVVVTDQPYSFCSAFKMMGLSGRHEQGRRKDNRAENSHQPVRRRERRMQCFKSPRSAQRFPSVHSAAYNNFNVRRHLIARRALRITRTETMEQWRVATAAA